MHYIVRAQFVDKKPCLQVIHSESGRICVQWELSKLEQLFQSGEINMDEFPQPERYGMKLLVKNLFLIGCSQDLDSSPEVNKKFHGKI